MPHESVIKFIFVNENFFHIYIIYININEEINILIFEKYYELNSYF